MNRFRCTILTFTIFSALCIIILASCQHITPVPPVVTETVRSTQRVYVAMDVSIRGDIEMPIADLYMYLFQRVRKGDEPFRVIQMVRQFPGECVPTVDIPILNAQNDTTQGDTNPPVDIEP